MTGDAAAERHRSHRALKATVRRGTHPRDRVHRQVAMFKAHLKKNILDAARGVSWQRGGGRGRADVRGGVRDVLAQSTQEMSATWPGRLQRRQRELDPRVTLRKES